MRKFCTIIFVFTIFISFNLFSKDTYFYYNKNKFKRKLPAAYQISAPVMHSKVSPGLSLNIYSRSFKQGEAVYVEFVPKRNDSISNLKAFYLKKEVRLSSKKWGFRGFFGIHPNAKVQTKYIKYSYTFEGTEYTKWLNFSVRKTIFPSSTYNLEFKGYSNTKPLSKETLAFIKRSTKKKKAAFASAVPDYIDSVIAHPRNEHKITSGFWKNRKYSRYVVKNGKRKYLKPSVKIHRGLDLRGALGTPCFAMMKGKVVLADLLYYEGNMVILNHGNNIFSYYMHLNKPLVIKGNVVGAGMQIAEVGSTGRSTAAHLHVSVVIDGTQVDPLSLFMLPIRD